MNKWGKPSVGGRVKNSRVSFLIPASKVKMPPIAYLLKVVAYDTVGIVAPTQSTLVCFHTSDRNINLYGVVKKYRINEAWWRCRLAIYTYKA